MTLPPSCSSHLCLPRLEDCRPLPACLVFASILIFLLLFKIKVVPSLTLLFSVESYILPSANIRNQTWWPLFSVFCVDWKQSAEMRVLCSRVSGGSSVSCFASILCHLCSSTPFSCFLSAEEKEVLCLTWGPCSRSLVMKRQSWKVMEPQEVWFSGRCLGHEGTPL